MATGDGTGEAVEAAGGLVAVIISGVVFSVEIVLSAELDKDGLGGGAMIEPSVLAFLEMGIEGEEVPLDSRFLLFLCFMGSLGPLGESELGVGDHWAGGEVG